MAKKNKRCRSSQKDKQNIIKLRHSIIKSLHEDLDGKDSRTNNSDDYWEICGPTQTNNLRRRYDYREIYKPLKINNLRRRYEC